MAFEGHVRLQGSERAPLPGAVLEGPADPDQQVQVTVFVRRRVAALDLLERIDRLTPFHPHFSPDLLAARHGADPADVERIANFAMANNLQVVSADAQSRRVQLSGTVAQLQAFFGTELGLYRRQDDTYRGRIGPVQIPADIGDVVEAVVGLDDRPQAQPHIAVAALTPAAVTALSPAQVASLYNFPTGVTGQNQCIAIIELGGGFIPSDLDTFFAGSGVPVPSVTAVSVDGAQNSPSSPPSVADIETALDIQVVAGVAPGAKIAVYFAPNTDRGFLDAITTAVHDSTNRPSIISISWGSAERNWTQQAMQTMEQAFVDAAALGITVCCASGDNGSSDSVNDGQAHADFPASAPHALGCGGTTLNTGAAAILAETVWSTGSSATGGGISDVFDVPQWQAGAGVPPSANANQRVGRGVPDVSGDADPATGYRIVVGGAWQTIGGTSAVAPLWAGLAGLLNESLGTSVGFLQPFLYTPAVQRSCFRDITQGTNGAYAAQNGWDACTGLGSPNGQQLRSALSIGLGDHFYTASPTERDTALSQYGYLSAGIAGYAIAAPSTIPLYRLVRDHHFYTTSLAERDAAIHQSGFRSEGIAAWVSPWPVEGSVPLYRLANFVTGDHFYTTSADERDTAIRDSGYQSEGIACYVYSSEVAGVGPVYRLANNRVGDHFYTTSTDERDSAIRDYGYQSEDVAFYALASGENVPLYRLSNAYHWYTTSLDERDNAIARGDRSEDVACFVPSHPLVGTSAFYRLLNPSTGARLYTASDAESNTAIADLGYQLEGTSGYLYTSQQAGTTPLFRLLRTNSSV